jgi:hypothetical protein
MSDDRGNITTRNTRSRFPAGIFFKALLPALGATVVFVFLFSHFTRTAARGPRPRADGFVRVTLSQKDASYHPIPPSAGGASAEVWYSPTGSTLKFQLHAIGLPHPKRYLLELQEDGVIYTVASYAANEHGEISIDTALTQFAEGVCVGSNYDAPRPVEGHHDVKFWIKRDGNPPSGTMPGVAPNAPGAQLLCHGNGDGQYGYVLLDNDVAKFDGSGVSQSTPH